MDLKVPPNNIEAEKAVLGSILIENDSLNKVIDILSADDFYDPKNELIYGIIVDLYSASKPIDVLTLNSEIKKRNKNKQSGGASYISELIEVVPTSANIKDYADIVKESSTRRKLITMSSKFTEIARKEDEKIDDVLNTVEKEVFSLTQNTSTVDFFHSAKLIEMQMEKADEYAKNPGKLRGLGTGLKSLDGILGGLHTSDLVILAARPAVGKSAFSFDIARHIAVNEKKTIAIFSLEMPGVQVIERMLAQQTKLNLWDLRMGNLQGKDDFQKYNLGASELSEAKIFVDETAGINIMQLRSKARKLKIEHNLDLMIIDYLQLMQGYTKDRENRAQEVGEISRSLKILARELNIPIIALSQLNRAVENRIDRIPQLSDLRESGSIEQDADLVMFLSRDMQEEPDAENDFIKVDLSIAKHRNGPIGIIKLKFFGKQTRFEDYE